MFSFEYTEKFTFFITDSSNERIPTADWNTLKEQYQNQIFTITELLENGLAEKNADSYHISASDILNLSYSDQAILGLPDQYPYELYIQSIGQLNQAEFKVQYGFFDFVPNGNLLIAKRLGPLVYISDTIYLLSNDQFIVCEEIDSFNYLPNEVKNLRSSSAMLDKVKVIANSNTTLFDSYLSNQNSYFPKKIILDFEQDNGLIRLLPSFNIPEDYDFKNKFKQFPLRDFYNVTEANGSSKRILLDDSQKEVLSELKKTDPILPSKFEETIDQLSTVFDEETVDFSALYSDRVKEIGVYKPQFYPFVSPYKSEWIPGIIIKDKIEGEKRIYLKTEADVKAFIHLKDEAVLNNKNFIVWEEQEIPLQHAETVIHIAQKQFESPKKPISLEPDLIEKNVLIIKENAEYTEFSQVTTSPASIDHTLYTVQNLAKNLTLKDHQKEGIAWLQNLYLNDLSGSLLADDMGLGKTLQLLYFIEWHAQNYNQLKPYLIVAPISLLENWQNEHKKFFENSDIKIVNLQENKPLTRAFDTERNKKEAQQFQFKHIILTNYETLRIYQATLGLIDFAVIALDEAQKIKTPGTLITNACKALKADFKITMTGTPVENTLLDIWCILDFSVPGLLGNAKDFAKEFQNPLRDTNVDVVELTSKLRNRIGVFLKRRLKIDVAKDLPKKHDGIESRIKYQMPPTQLERYKLEFQKVKEWTSESEVKNQKLKSLWAMRDISDHPYLLENQITSYTTKELIESSAKLQITVGLIQQIKFKNEKVIIFADRRETQKMIQKVIYESFYISPSIINGDTPTTKKQEGKTKLSRQQTIDIFQEKAGFNIIIMSPLAAGVGLNVTEANHIIHYSRHWNPAKEEQATDRAYRIGQTKDVFVHYPMAVFPDTLVDEKGVRCKSFDEVLDTLLHNKKVLASNALFPTEQAEVTPDELFNNVFSFETSSNPEILTIEKLDRLNPNLFEAAIAALYKAKGSDVNLTPYSNDKGVDVVVLGTDENLLIQVKQTKSLVGKDAIQEIVASQNYYSNKYKVTFKPMVIANNNFSNTAQVLASSNTVQLVNRNELIKLISETEITLQEINRQESQRKSKI